MTTTRHHHDGLRKICGCPRLKPIDQTPFALTSWEPDPDTQPEPAETGGERTAQPTAG